MASPVLGIDLGTTNSVVACADEQRVRVLRDEDGQLITPSTVSFDPSGRMLVGHEARERRLVDAQNTIFSVKRLIGRPFRSLEVQRAAARLPFKLEEGATGGAVVRVRGETYSLPEISSFILRKVRAVAEAALGEACSNAVITVPANFNELQRMATRDAGRIAGLNVLRILNEPTAAALAYGYRATQGQRIAVYDLGGGTFDISILELSGDVIEVVATAGDTNLGGDDLDSVIADRMVAEFRNQHSVDVAKDLQQYERVRMAAEWLKCQLSHQESAEAIVKEVAWGGGRIPLDLRFRLSRVELQRLAAPLIKRTFASCEEAMRLANVRPTQLDGVILVGGQTRTPAVRKMVAEFFGKEPLSTVDPELVVAQGAALQGYALSGMPAAEPRSSTLLGNPPAPADAAGVDPFDNEPTRVVDRVDIPVPKRSELPFDDLPTTVGFRPDPDDELTRVGEYVTSQEVEQVLAAAREVSGPTGSAPPLAGGRPRPPPPAAPRTPPLAPGTRRTGAEMPSAKATGHVVARPSLKPPRSAPASALAFGAEESLDIALVDESHPGLPALLRAAAQPAHDPKKITQAERPKGRAAARESVKPLANRAGAAEGFDPIRTHSMARLLARQGHRNRALAIYDELIAGGNSEPAVVEEARVLRSHEPVTSEGEVGTKPAPGDLGWSPSSTPPDTLSLPGGAVVHVDPAMFLSDSTLLRSQFPGPPNQAPLLLDVTPLTLSVETAGGFCESIVERNAPIPTEQTRVFSTSQDEQATVSVRVCQGESRRTDENQVLGQVELTGLRRARRGEVSIAVTFMIDADGTLNVKATDRTTGQGQAIRVDLVGAIGDRELERMRSRQRPPSDSLSPPPPAAGQSQSPAAGSRRPPRG